MAIQVLAKKAIQKVVSKAVEKAGEKAVEKGAEKVGSKVGEKAGKNLMRKRMAEIGSRNPDAADNGGDLQTESVASMPDKQVRTNQFKEDPEQVIARSRQLRAEQDSPMMRSLQSPEEKEHNQLQAEAVEAGATSFEDGAARRYIDPKQFRENAVGDAWNEETQKLAGPKTPEPRTDLNWEGRGNYSYNLNLDDPSNPSVKWTDKDGKTGVWTPEDKGAWDAIMAERTEQIGGVTPETKPTGDVRAAEPAPAAKPVEGVPPALRRPPESSVFPEDNVSPVTPRQPEPVQESAPTGAKRAADFVTRAKAEGMDPTSVSKQLQALAQQNPAEAQAIRGIIDDYIDYAGGEVARKAQARSNPPNVRMAAME